MSTVVPTLFQLCGNQIFPAAAADVVPKLRRIVRDMYVDAAERILISEGYDAFLRSTPRMRLTVNAVHTGTYGGDRTLVDPAWCLPYAEKNFVIEVDMPKMLYVESCTRMLSDQNARNNVIRRFFLESSHDDRPLIIFPIDDTTYFPYTGRSTSQDLRVFYRRYTTEYSPVVTIGWSYGDRDRVSTVMSIAKLEI